MKGLDQHLVSENLISKASLLTSVIQIHSMHATPLPSQQPALRSLLISLPLPAMEIPFLIHLTLSRLPLSQF